MIAEITNLTDGTRDENADRAVSRPIDVMSHLPMLLIGLRWLFDTAQLDTALQQHHGQQIGSVGNRTLRFIPSGWNGHAIVVVDVAHVDYGQPHEPPRNPLAPGELAAFADLLDGMGEDVAATWNGHPAITGSLALARPAHPSLQAAVSRYTAGCQRHGGDRLCPCDWYIRGHRHIVSISDLHEQALQRRTPAHRGRDAMANLTTMTDRATESAQSPLSAARMTADMGTTAPHDTRAPSSSTEHANGDKMPTTDTLEDARHDLQTARDCVDDPHRRRQYALAAMDLAATVVLSDNVTPEQRRAASEYLTEASTISGRSASGDLPGRQRSPRHHEPTPLQASKAGIAAARSGLRR